MAEAAAAAAKQGPLMLVFLDFGITTTPSGSSTSSTSSWSSCTEDGQQLQFWPTALLPHAPTALLLKCDVAPDELRSSKKRGRTAAAKLAQLVQSAAGNSRVVLVAHGFDGHQLKEVCLHLQRGAASPQLPAWQRQQYACTLARVCGLVFYSTPHKPCARLALPEYEYVLPDIPSVCQRFRALCKQQGWKTLGLGAPAPAATATSGSAVPLSAAAHGMDSFVVVPGADQHSVCRPSSRHHPACAALAQFAQQLLLAQARAPLDVQPVPLAAAAAAADDSSELLAAQAAAHLMMPAVARASLFERLALAVVACRASC